MASKMKFDGKNLLVIGSSGLTGEYFFEKVAKEKYKKRIKCLIREHSDVRHLERYGLNLEFKRVNFGDDEVLKKEMIGTDTVLNIAGIHLSETITRCGKDAKVTWYICVHTAAIFYTHERNREKYIRIEKELLETCENLTILRPTMIYGNDRDRNMHKVIKLVDKYPVLPLFGNGKSLISPIYARDLGNAYYSVLANRKLTFGKQYNLCGGTTITLVDLLQETAMRLGKKRYYVSLPIWFCLAVVYLAKFILKSRVPVFVEQVKRSTEDRVVNCKNAHDDFGFAPIPFRDGIRKQIKDYRSRHLS